MVKFKSISRGGRKGATVCLSQNSGIKGATVCLSQNSGKVGIKKKENEKKRRRILKSEEFDENKGKQIPKKRSKAIGDSKTAAANSSEDIIDIKDEISDSVDLITRCLPSGLVKLCSALSVEQRTAVREIGFDSLFELKLTEIPRDMLRFVYAAFNTSGRVLCVSPGKEFQLRAEDVPDVFGIPIGNVGVPKTGKFAEKDLKDEFKSRLGETVADLDKNMRNNRSGNTDFKRCFVMYAMATFLASRVNRTVDFRLVGALKDADEIKNYNWCQFVLDDLAESLQDYSHQTSYVRGCLLLLTICYFHRHRFRGIDQPKTLPLIKH